MLRIITGPFHPDLELELVREVRQLKTEAPLAPLAIIVPSSTLSAHLRRVLALEADLPLLNVHFLTFHQLALRLYEEGRRDAATPADPPLLPVDDLFFEQLLRYIVQRDLPGLERFRQFGQTPGIWEAIWATLRDLKDAMVDPAVALHAVEEGLFGAEEAATLQALFRLYASLLEARRALSVGTPEDVASAALEHVAGSPFLFRVERLYYYGFYDLTQVQLSLFEAIAASASVTLFFPLCDDPTFAFARRFFERHILPQAEPTGIGPRSSAESQSTAHSHSPENLLFSAVGAEDELATVCKQILLLVEAHGYRFDEIGVVARTLGPYQTAVQRLFDRHRIPVRSSVGAPLIQEPGVKILLQLASLPLTGLYRTPIMDLLTSPFYRLPQSRGAEPRPDLWGLAVRRLGIIRGEEEWQRLASAAHADLMVEARNEMADVEEPDAEPERGITIDAAQLQLLWQLVEALLADVRGLPARGGFGELTAAFLEFASRHLTVPGLGDADGDASADDAVAPVGAALRTVFDKLRRLDRIGDEVGWAEWVRVFTRLAGQAMVAVPEQNHPGVLVLDAMAARGLRFRALFLLGLNEKVFPRFIREDAFLRDRHRRVLDATLGYKIDEKLTGYDEERLLFALLVQAARDRLYLLYQRADVESRPLVASTYLSETMPGSPTACLEDEIRVPRRFSDRVGTPPFLPALLEREEYARWQVLRGEDPSPLLETTGQGAHLFRAGWHALRLLEGEPHVPGPYDGITGPLERYWDQLATSGVSPTSLERYARCPFQYFSAQVLHLEAKPAPMEEVSAQTLGELCHAVLHSCYRQLTEAGWPARQLPPASLQHSVEAAAEQVFTSYAQQHGTGYALIWQLARESVTALARSVVEADQDDCRATGYHPVAFEVEAEGRLEDLEPGTSAALPVRGRLDRLDRRLQPPGLRVIDYKYRSTGTMKKVDLITSAIRGIRLQPPLYAVMTPVSEEPASQARETVPVECVELLFVAPHCDPPVDRVVFDSATWQTPAGQQIKSTIGTLLQGIRQGQYHILPGRYCIYCDFSAACRRFHSPTWWRAYRAPSAQRLRQLRKLKVQNR